MDDLQNEANPFIIISQTKIWTKTVQNIFNHTLGLFLKGFRLSINVLLSYEKKELQAEEHLP